MNVLIESDEVCKSSKLFDPIKNDYSVQNELKTLVVSYTNGVYLWGCVITEQYKKLKC